MAVEEDSAGPGGEMGLVALYERYSAALLRLCARRLGNAVHAEDAMHETLLRADKARGSFREGAPVWPWLATIAANVCTDMTRRDGRLHRIAQPEHDDLVPDATYDVERRSKRRLVRDALASLPPAYRRSVFLHHFAGMTHDEIAEHEKTTPAAVRSRLMRARRLLRDRVEQLATQRNDWPVPAAAPVLRRVQVAFSRVEPAVTERAGTAAQYVAALLFATGVIAGGGGLADVGPADAAVEAPRVAATIGTGGPTGAANAAVSLRATPGGIDASVRAPAPVQRVAPPPVLQKTVTSPIPIKEGDDQRLLVFEQNCGTATKEPGPVGKALCSAFPDGIKL